MNFNHAMSDDNRMLLLLSVLWQGLEFGVQGKCTSSSF